MFWAVAHVDIAQAAIKIRARRKKFEVMNKSDKRPAGSFGMETRKGRKAWQSSYTCGTEKVKRRLGQASCRV
jgi:hypothetical protein